MQASTPSHAARALEVETDRAAGSVDDSSAPVAGPSRRARSVPRSGRLARAGLEAAGWAYLVLAMLVCVDVVGRRMLGVSTAATTEIGGYLLAVGIAWGLAGTLVERAHIRIDVFVQKAPVRTRVALHVLALAVLAAAALFAVYGAARVAIDSWQLGATDLTPLRLPLVVPQGLWAIGLAVFALTAIGLLITVARAALSGDAARADAICAPKTYEDEATETLDALGRTRPADWPPSAGHVPATPRAGEPAPRGPEGRA